MKVKQKKLITKFGFLLSVIGSAVGLGGIWGFPRKMAEYKGAFFIPFLICMMLCAIPLLFLEMTIANKSRKNHVEFFSEKAGKKGAFFAWLHSSSVIMLSTYYSVIIGWTIISIIISFTNNLNTEQYFYNEFLNLKSTDTFDTMQRNIENTHSLGSMNWVPFLAMLSVWLMVFAILFSGVAKGIDKANRVFVPGLFIIIIILVIYTSTLPNAGKSINTMFTFEVKQLTKSKIWSDAFGQAFFMLSTSTGTIYVYASHAPRNEDNTNHAFIVGIGSTIVGVLTSIIVFNAVGYYAATTTNPVYRNDITIEQAILSIFQQNKGPLLVFRTLTNIFSNINKSLFGLGNFVAIIFFIALFFAGISSLIGQVESMIHGLEYQTKISRVKSLLLIIPLEIVVSSVFVFKWGPGLIDIVGDWVSGQWLLLMAMWLLFSMNRYGWKLYPELKAHNDKVSWIKWNKFFTVTILVVAPIFVTINAVLGFYNIANSILSYPFIGGLFGILIGVMIPLILTIFLTYQGEINCYFTKISSFIKQKNQVAEER